MLLNNLNNFTYFNLAYIFKINIFQLQALLAYGPTLLRRRSLLPLLPVRRAMLGDLRGIEIATKAVLLPSAASRTSTPATKMVRSEVMRMVWVMTVHGMMAPEVCAAMATTKTTTNTSREKRKHGQCSREVRSSSLSPRSI